MTLSRTAKILGAITVFAFAVSACAGGNSANTTPDQATPSLSYDARGVPYVYKGKLYINHKAQPGSWVGAKTAGGYTAATRFENDLGLTMVILRDGKELETVPGVVSGPEFSPDDTKLAWVTLADHDAGTLVVHDLTTFRVLGQLSITVQPDGDKGISVPLEIDNDATAYYELRHESWSWKPGGTPTRAEAPGCCEVHNPEGFSEVKASVALSPDHLWGAWVSTGLRSLSVQKPGDPSSKFTIALPAGTGPGGFVQWDSPTVALVFMSEATKDGRQQIGACDIGTRKCTDATGAY
jgi:hypothetical protein